MHIRNLDASCPKGSDSFHSRRARHIDEHARLWRNLSVLVASNPRLEPRSPDDLLENLIYRAGFENHDLALVGVSVGGKPVNLVGVPMRLWQRPLDRFTDLKATAAAYGVKLVLVPASAVQRQPRLGNAMLAAGDLEVAVCASDRMAIVAELIESGGSTLGECAALVAHPDPFGAVLHLAITGVVHIDLNRTLSPNSPVSMPDHDAGTYRYRGRFGDE